MKFKVTKHCKDAVRGYLGYVSLPSVLIIYLWIILDNINVVFLIYIKAYRVNLI